MQGFRILAIIGTEKLILTEVDGWKEIRPFIAPSYNRVANVCHSHVTLTILNTHILSQQSSTQVKKNCSIKSCGRS